MFQAMPSRSFRYRFVDQVGIRCWVLVLAMVCGGEPTSATAQQAKQQPPADPTAAPAQPAQPARHAFKLGEFRIKNFRPVEREKVTLDFTVYAEVEDGQQEQFARAWSHLEHRVRSQVITSARLVPASEFDDPALHAFRRRIYLRLRRAVPELPVAEVYVSDFSYIVE